MGRHSRATRSESCYFFHSNKYPGNQSVVCVCVGVFVRGLLSVCESVLKFVGTSQDKNMRCGGSNGNAPELPRR